MSIPWALLIACLYSIEAEFIKHQIGTWIDLSETVIFNVVVPVADLFLKRRERHYQRLQRAARL